MTYVFGLFILAVAANSTDPGGQPLPAGAVSRIGSAHFRHSASVRDVAFSPDGSRLAATCDDGNLWVWDAATGRLVGRTAVGPDATVEYGRDGKEIGTYTPAVGLRVFDLDIRKALRSVDSNREVGGPGMKPGRQPVPVLAPGLKWLAYRDDKKTGRVLVVDPATGHEAAALGLRHGGWETRVVFSADGNRLVVGDSESKASTIWVYDVVANRMEFEQDVDGRYMPDVSLSRDGARAMAVLMPHISEQKASVKVWDVALRRLLLDYPLGWHYHSAAIAPDGRTVAVLEKEKISLLDVATAKVVQKLESRFDYGPLVYAPTGRTLAVVGNRNAVELFDLPTGRAFPPRAETFDPDKGTDVRFRSDGKVVFRFGGEPALSVYDPLTGHRTETIELPSGGKWIHAVSPDGRRLIYSVGVAKAGDYRLWDRGRAADVAAVKLPSLYGRFDFTPDGRRLFLYQNYFTPTAVALERNPDTLEPVNRIPIDGRANPFVHSLDEQFSGDGLHLFHTVCDADSRPTGTIRHWSATSGAEQPTIRWAPAKTLITDRLGEMRIFRSATANEDGRWLGVGQFIGRREEKREDNRDPITGLNHVCVFDTADGRERIRIAVRPDPGEEGVYDFRSAISPDGRLVAVFGHGGACRVYETASGTERRRVSGAAGRVTDWTAHNMYAAAFSRDSRLLVTIGHADAALVWNLHDSDAPFVGSGMPAAWEALAEPSARKAYPALAWLTGRGDEAARFLQGNLRPTPAPTAEQVGQWVQQLGADAFRDRTEAERRLRWVAGQHAARFSERLRQDLKDTPNLEVRERLERVLATTDRFEPLPEEIRAARGVEALERIGTPAARTALAALALGPAEAWLTRDAKAALTRMAR